MNYFFADFSKLFLYELFQFFKKYYFSNVIDVINLQKSTFLLYNYVSTLDVTCFPVAVPDTEDKSHARSGKNTCSSTIYYSVKYHG